MGSERPSTGAAACVHSPPIPVVDFADPKGRSPLSATLTADRWKLCAERARSFRQRCCGFRGDPRMVGRERDDGAQIEGESSSTELLFFEGSRIGRLPDNLSDRDVEHPRLASRVAFAREHYCVAVLPLAWARAPLYKEVFNQGLGGVVSAIGQVVDLGCKGLRRPRRSRLGGRLLGFDAFNLCGKQVREIFVIRRFEVSERRISIGRII
jgi:hypothetical protein